MTKTARFEDEADAEYRAAGRWYEERVVGLGIEFFDAVDAALDQIARLPKAGALVQRVPIDLQVRRAPVARFPYTSSISKRHRQFACWRSPMSGAGPGIGRRACSVLFSPAAV